MANLTHLENRWAFPGLRYIPGSLPPSPISPISPRHPCQQRTQDVGHSLPRPQRAAAAKNLVRASVITCFTLLTCNSTKHSQLATIIVGREKSKFVADKELLTFHSPYFRAALTRGFKEAVEGVVRLRDELNRHIFEFFVHWLYHQRLPNENDSLHPYNTWADKEAGGIKQTESLIRLYVLSDKYNVPKLKNDAITALFSHIEHDTATVLPLLQDVRFAFDNLPDGNPLCRYLVDAYCYWATANVWSDFASLPWPTKFIARVLAQYTEFARSGRDTFNMNVCDNHEHANEGGRIACRKAELDEEDDNMQD